MTCQSFAIFVLISERPCLEASSSYRWCNIGDCEWLRGDGGRRLRSELRLCAESGKHVVS
jgi:hypothetical protein